MKKILALLLALSMLLCLAACAGTTTAKTEETKTETAKSDKDYEIVVVPKGMPRTPGSSVWTPASSEYAAETGLNVYQKGTDVIDATKQAQLVQDLIAQGVDAICVVPVDPESLEPVLKQAREAGIVVIAHEGASRPTWTMTLKRSPTPAMARSSWTTSPKPWAKKASTPPWSLT